MTVPFDYDAAPERYRLGMQTTRAHADASLYQRVAHLLGDLGASVVLDVGCAEGALRAAMPVPGPRLIGLDVSVTLLRTHPAPAVQADAVRLPFADRVFDAVTAVNVLYHLRDPMPAVREMHRVLRAGGHLVAAAIARNDSPEFDAYWLRPATSFDAEDAPDLRHSPLGLRLLATTLDPAQTRSWIEPSLTNGAIRADAVQFLRAARPAARRHHCRRPGTAAAEPTGEVTDGFPHGARHGADLLYFFDSYAQGSAPRADEQARLAETLIAHWTTFARTGDPGGGWRPRPGPAISFATAGSREVDIASTHRCGFWSRLRTH